MKRWKQQQQRRHKFGVATFSKLSPNPPPFSTYYLQSSNRREKRRRKKNTNKFIPTLYFSCFCWLISFVFNCALCVHLTKSSIFIKYETHSIMYSINYANIKNNSDDLCTFLSPNSECISQVFFIVLEKIYRKIQYSVVVAVFLCVWKRIG